MSDEGLKAAEEKMRAAGVATIEAYREDWSVSPDGLGWGDGRDDTSHEAVDELEQAIATGKLPVHHAGVFDQRR